MNTAKLTWLLIATMMATLTVMPAPIQAEATEITIQIEVVTSPWNIPEGETFPYVDIWKIWCMTDGIPGWDVATNLTRDDLADATIPSEIDTVMFKLFVHENLTGWYITPFYLEEDNGEIFNNQSGFTADGLPWVSTELGDNASAVYDATGDLNTWWFGPVIDWWGGILLAGTETSSQLLTYTAVVSFPMGNHIYHLTGITKDCIDDGEGRLVEQWVSCNDYVDIFLHHDDAAARNAPTAVEEPLSLVFGLLAVLSVSIVTLARKKN
jgi:hypothetical protein